MPLKSPKGAQRNFPNFNEQEISKRRMQYVKERALTIDKLSMNIVYDSEIKELIYVNMILFNKYLIYCTEKESWIFQKFESGRYYNSSYEYDTFKKNAYALYRYSYQSNKKTRNMENKKNKKTIGAPKIMGFIHVFLNELGSGTSISHGKLIVYENSPDAKIIEKAVQYVKERALTANEICQGNIYDSKTKKTVYIYRILSNKYLVCRTDKGCRMFQKFESGRYYNSFVEYDKIQSEAYSLYGIIYSLNTEE